MVIRNYKKLDVWIKAVELVTEIYSITRMFPRDEQFGLTSQMRRCAVSIPSNIAEGKMRGYDKEFKRFLLISFASGAELETQIEISRRLPEMKDLSYDRAEALLTEVMKMLNRLIQKLSVNG